MSAVARIELQEMQPEQELRALINAASGAGAVVSFVGIARPSTGERRAVEKLILDHHPVLTQQSLEKISADACARFDVSHVRVVHRCGAVAAGDAIVFAGAASAHRRAAFEAADFLMDMLKTEAVFWKREVSTGSSTWIEPTSGDFSDRSRWE
jgi:molybdopterin synthase catalytic subunit